MLDLRSAAALVAAVLALLLVGAGGGAAATGFNVASVTALNATTIVVTFDAAPDLLQATALANYSVPGLTLTGVPTLVGNSVTLTTTVQAARTYTLTVSGVTRAVDELPLTVASGSFAGAGTTSTAPTVSGSGIADLGAGPITFSVHAAGTGPTATGSMQYSLNGDVISGHVVCLAASSTTANVIAQIDSSPVPSNAVGAVGHYMTFFLGSDGPGSFGTDFAYTTDDRECWDSPALDSAPLQTGSIAIAGGDPTPPVVTPTVTGALGNDGWYTGDVHVGWAVAEPDSYLAGTYGCDGSDITSDTYGQPFTCDAWSGGGRGTGSVVVRRDATPPRISILSRTPPNAAGWNDTPVKVAFACFDALSGVASCPPDLTFDQEGTNQQRTVTAADSAGNTADDTVSGVDIDLTPPRLSGAATTAPNGDGWYRGNVTIHWTCSDALSGPASCPGDSTISGEGANLRATAFVRDVAGNLTNGTSDAVSIDRTPPLTSASAPVGWSKSAVNVTLSALDNLSGIEATYAQVDGGPAQASSSVAISGDGTHTLTYWSVDKAGNVEPQRSVTVQIDTSAPSITHTLTPVPNAAGWNDGDVTVAFQCSDSVSGIASCSPPQLVTGEGASLSVTGTAENNAGWTTDDTANVAIDRTPPTITAAADRAPNADGWYGDDVVVAFDCKDALSGVAACPAPVRLGEGAGQSAAGTATDIAGNTANATLSGIDVDKTAPVVTYAGNQGTYSVADTVAITCTATDALSGVASSTCADISGPAWQFGLGVTNRSATATDRAGNAGTGSVSFSVGVTAASLETLIGRLVSDPGVAAALQAKVEAVAAAPNGNAKAGKVAAFDNQIDAQTGKAIGAADAALLERLVAAL